MKSSNATSMHLAHREILLLWGLLLLLLLGLGAKTLMERWATLDGHEFAWIATSIAEGHGYGFPGDRRWLFRGESAPDEYNPTAWLPPVYPIFMGLSLRFFGEHGRLLIGAVQLLSFFGTVALIYPLGRRLFGTPWPGLVASTLLVTSPTPEFTILRVFSNAALTGLLVVLLTMTILWCCRRITIGRGVLLGALLGLTVETHASTILFCPISVFAVLIAARFSRESWLAVIATTVTCTALMTPWAIRNAIVFEELVLTRTGLGFNTYLCNNVIAETARPELALCDGPPSWEVDGDMDAILKAREPEALAPMLVRAFGCMATFQPEGFAEMNEPQRDSAYFHEFLGFVADHPGVFLTLTLKKTLAFYVGMHPRGWSGWGPSKALIAVAALLGIITGWRNPRVWLLVAMLAAYTFPYALGLPYYFRYRYPVEPLLLLLASNFAVLGLSFGRTALLRSPLGERLLAEPAEDAAPDPVIDQSSRSSAIGLPIV